MGEKLGKLFVPIFLALNLIVVLGGSFLVYKSTMGYVPPAVAEKELYDQYMNVKTTHESKPVLYTMEPFNVNLDGFPKRVLRLQVNLEMLDEEGFEEIITLGPQARDSVMRLLNSKNYADLETVQGKLTLKDQIASTLNTHLNKGVIKDVYFSDLVVQ
jgi:flagellar FliL protein